jgi:hypothetical protein
MGHLYHFTPAVSSKKLWDTVSFSKGEKGSGFAWAFGLEGGYCWIQIYDYIGKEQSGCSKSFLFLKEGERLHICASLSFIGVFTLWSN